MSAFWYVLLAHLLYDFHWQGPFIADMKGKSNFILAVHALTWAVLICAVLQFFGIFTYWHLLFLFATHFLIDRWKSKLPKTDKYFWAIYVDQGAHLITLIIALQPIK